MATEKKLIGTIPIQTILDQGNQAVNQINNDASVLFNNIDSSVNTLIEEFEQTADNTIQQIEQTAGVLMDCFETIQDPEKRSEITLDSSNKVISYRDSDGIIHENAGIKTANIKPDHIDFSESTIDEISEIAEAIVDEKSQTKEKKYYLPKFGTVIIKEETFYLTSDQRYNDKDGIVLIQMLDDTTANAAARRTLSYYYVKSTLTPLPDGSYDRTSVNENSVRLDFYPAKEVVEDNGHYYVKSITKVNGTFYFTSTLVEKEVEGQTVYVLSTETGGASISVNYEDSSVADQTTLTNAIEVTQIKDVPPYKAWAVNKNPEHYCVAEIDFGSFYYKNNIPVRIKIQGSSSSAQRMKGLRITFYKKNDYKKKDKVKIGEMVRLSGYNMKAYFGDSTMVKDPILSNLFMEIWESRGKDCYPWNKDSIIYNGATGFIKSFPIKTYFGSEFYGLQFFSLKKDEKNYMLDGDDDASGIFAVGNTNSSTMWTNANHTMWDDEMMDEMSQETADALDELFKYTKGFVNGTIEIDGVEVEFTRQMLEEHIDIASWIDYWIGLQVFLLWDNTYHNMVLHTRADKKLFYVFFYDVDNAMSDGISYDTDLITFVKEHGIPVTNPRIWLDTSFWEKFLDEYKDSLINRYAELRKNVLTVDNIRSIYKAYTENIPEDVIAEHQNRWNVSSSPKNFENCIEFLENRLNWLDETYFNLI